MLKAVNPPLTSAARNAVWTYPRAVRSRFPRGVTIVEMTRSYEPPEFDQLPEGSEVEIDLYGGAYKLKLDGYQKKVYVRKFAFILYPTEGEARQAFRACWEKLANLNSPGEVESAAEAWYESQQLSGFASSMPHSRSRM